MLLQNLVYLPGLHLLVDVDNFNLVLILNRPYRCNLLLHDPHPISSAGLLFDFPLLPVDVPNFHLLLLLQLLNFRYLVLRIFNHLFYGSQVALFLFLLHIAHLLVIEKHLVLGVLPGRGHLRRCLQERVSSYRRPLLHNFNISAPILNTLPGDAIGKFPKINKYIPTETFLMHNDVLGQTGKIPLITIPQVQIRPVITIKK